MEHEMLLELLNKLEEKITTKLENLTKNYTKEQFEQEYETAKNNLNAYSSDINLSRAERYKNWVELETTYSFYAKKLEAKGEKIMKTTKYYVEFENVCSQQTYSIQSRYFDTEKQAHNWYKKNIDFVADDTIVWLMQATFDENGELDEIALNGKNITNER